MQSKRKQAFFFLRLHDLMWSNAIAKAYYLSIIQKCILFLGFFISMTCSFYLFLKTWFNVREENERPFLCCIFNVWSPGTCKEPFPNQVVNGEWPSKWLSVFWVTSMLTWQNLIYRRTCVKIIIQVGWLLTIFDGNFTQTSLQFNLITPRQRAFSDSPSAQITEMRGWLMVPTP